MSDNPSIVPQGKFRFWDFTERRHFFTDSVAQLSATDIKMGRECHWKLFHKFTQAIKLPKSIPLVVGSVFHAACEHYLKHKAKGGAGLEWQKLVGVFESEWQKGIVGLNFSKVNGPEAKAKAMAYFKPYFEQALPLLHPAGSDFIEKFFNLKITNKGIVLGFTGKVDLVDKALWCIDHKTASQEWSQEDADQEIQAQLYPYCLQKLGIQVRGFKFMVVSKGRVTPFEVAYDEQKVFKILREAFELKKNIEEGNLLRAKSGRACKYCDYNSVCKEKIES
jgi:CRISPR/Cas system-associated exonuclease Cas4 (RecB family)